MNLRLVRKKIKSIKNVRKITKAMQMVSAVKMRKAQQAELESRPYRDGITALIHRLANDSLTQESSLGQIDISQAARDLLIVISSNKGLAGSFNMNVFRYMFAKELLTDRTDTIVVGHKGAQMISRFKRSSIIANFTSAHPTTEASALFELAVKQYKTGAYRSVSLVYNRFISTMKSEVMCEQILPIMAVNGDETKGEKTNELHRQQNGHRDHLIEPSAREIVEQLILSYLEHIIRGAITSSEAVEHSARMMAMKSATENAGDLIHNMTLLANRLRQEKITYELLDMITATESVGT